MRSREMKLEGAHSDNHRADPLLRVARLERPRHFFRAIVLEHIADLEVVEVLDADTTLESFAHFAHIFLEAAQRRDGAVVNLHAVADDAHATLAVDGTAAHRAPGDD